MKERTRREIITIFDDDDERLSKFSALTESLHA